MAWKPSGQLIETCSCNMLCPCWFALTFHLAPSGGTRWSDAGLPHILEAKSGARAAWTWSA